MTTSMPREPLSVKPENGANRWWCGLRLPKHIADEKEGKTLILGNAMRPGHQRRLIASTALGRLLERRR